MMVNIMRTEEQKQLKEQEAKQQEQRQKRLENNSRQSKADSSGYLTRFRGFFGDGTPKGTNSTQKKKSHPQGRHSMIPQSNSNLPKQPKRVRGGTIDETKS